MELKEITNQQEWNGSLGEVPECSFTQSWEWGEILKSEGKEVKRLQLLENSKVIGMGQFIKNKVFGFEYFFCPKGPVLKDKHEEVYGVLRKYFANVGVVFVRFEPREKRYLEDSKSFKKTIDVNPRATSILELAQSEAELLEKMHAKTRYNIRLAEKKNLEIKREKNFEIFWYLMQGTGERDGFKLHDKKHYEMIFASPLSSQLTACVESKPIATMLLVGFGDTATYLFGASDYEHRQLMAPYLLQWQAIKDAKSQKYFYYDLFGIAPHRTGFSGAEYEYDEKHQYAGVTRFKLGFGGRIAEDPGTFDMIISESKYKWYEALRRLRRMI